MNKGTRIKASKVISVNWVDKSGKTKVKKETVTKRFTLEMWERIKNLEPEWEAIEEIKDGKVRELKKKEVVPQDSSNRELLIKQANELGLSISDNMKTETIANKVSEEMKSLMEKAKLKKEEVAAGGQGETKVNI